MAKHKNIPCVWQVSVTLHRQTCVRCGKTTRREKRFFGKTFTARGAAKNKLFCRIEKTLIAVSRNCRKIYDAAESWENHLVSQSLSEIGAGHESGNVFARVESAEKFELSGDASAPASRCYKAKIIYGCD